MLEADRNERRDGWDDGEDPIGRRPGAERQPDGEADEGIAITPRTTAGMKSSPALVFPMVRAVSPTVPWPNVYWPETNMTLAVARAPTKLPA